jgi:hypothetical protein
MYKFVLSEMPDKLSCRMPDKLLNKKINDLNLNPPVIAILIPMFEHIYEMNMVQPSTRNSVL